MTELKKLLPVDLELYNHIVLNDDQIALAILCAKQKKLEEEGITRNSPSAMKLEEISLTAEEKKIAFLNARLNIMTNSNLKDYAKKVKAVVAPPKYNADQMMDKIRSQGLKIDKHNEKVVWQLSLYFTGDSRSKLDTKKGILLYGGIGVGKTTLMKLFKSNPINSYSIFSVNKIADEYAKFGADSILKYKSLIMNAESGRIFGQKEIGACFDDLGTELDKKHFGNESNVMSEIIYSRYILHDSMASKTHITTNLNTEELEERYGIRIKSRLREMFNVLTFDEGSPDRRK